MMQMSNLIPQINDIVFAWQVPNDIFRDFNSIEKAWQERQDRKIPINPEHTVIMEFPDGFAWYDLHVAY